MKKLKVDDEGYASFICPGCENKHIIPVHAKLGLNENWSWNGDPISPTIKPSILYNVGGSNKTVPICHSRITGGKIEFLNDSTHKLAGKTVDLPEIE